MKKKLYSALLLGALLFSSTTSYAVELKADGWRFGIGGFLDLEYRYMDNMPMVKTTPATDTMPAMEMVMGMEETSSLDQRNFNLLFDAQKDQMRIHVNFQANHMFDSHEGQGDFHVLETYGDYFINDLYSIRAGNLLAPFGLYNESLYIASLFASSKLPLMYEMPMNYVDSSGEMISHNFMPSNANFMVYGEYWSDYAELSYQLYITNGESEQNGDDTNKDKGIGTRLRGIFFDNYKLGVSYYTVENDAAVGRQSLMGADLVVNLQYNLVWETEYLVDHYDSKDDRLAFYTRLSMNIKDKYVPFITYDYAEDDAHPLYHRGMVLYGTGMAYNMTDNVTLKTEYHYHSFNNADASPVLMNDLDKFHMFRADIIFTF